MSGFDFCEYLALAKSLSSRPPDGVNSEAVYRSIISRAYYSAFHAARDYKTARNWADPTPPVGQNSYGAHEKVIRAFLDFPAGSPIQTLGSNLNDLKSQRARADYDRTPAVVQSQAALAAISAQLILTQLGDLA